MNKIILTCCSGMEISETNTNVITIGENIKSFLVKKLSTNNKKNFGLYKTLHSSTKRNEVVMSPVTLINI